MSSPLTLMTVHAHPDDEAIGTGGTLARYADEGIQTVLVTCTGGEVGEIAPGTNATPDTLAEVRARELRKAADILAISHLEMLGYRDSGMAGTDDNGHPGAFTQADLDEATGKLVALVRRYRPHVLVTYDENGFYGHPDHINANRIAVLAFARAGDPTAYPEQRLAPWAPCKLYYTAVPRSALETFGARLAAYGITPPNGGGQEGTPETEPPFGTPDELVTTVLDVGAWVERKRRALWAHATQLGPQVFFSHLPPPLFAELFGHESYQLVESRVSTATPENDLFAGLRS
ncbi:MAG: PIG-L family deacetylase [Chloroflexi bacterium]|nr:PIG-L family deacetylase [Chloroflexota bacterium]